MEEIRPGVWIIYGENRGRFPFAHSLYLEGKRRLLIDTGAGEGLQQLIGRVDHVCLSHFHRDHVAGNDLFAGASFSIHPDDAPGVASAEGFFRLTGLSRFDESYWETLNQERFTATAAAAVHNEGDRIDLGGLTLRVLHTPGHTPGHCAFLVEEHNLLFAADIDLSRFGPWYGNDRSDPGQFQQSIERVRSLNAALLITSHSRPVTEDIDGRLERYGAIIEQRHKRICGLLGTAGLTLEELIDLKPIYRRHPEPVGVYRFFEGNMLKKHLDLLIDRGLVWRDGALYRAR